ncbi:MAG TPA: ATPase domain-containing protein [Longimicrobiales bacterium]|nr:ATPase domain-containing protein [Longimicrobiales bacterium]
MQTTPQVGPETALPGAGHPVIPTGIAPLDERVGGLHAGGSYLVVGSPGPAKMVAALQFLRAGLEGGESGVLVTGGDPQSILDAARGWGLDLSGHWRDGRLRVLGFRDDFELRAARSVEPQEVLEELDTQVGRDVSRVVVDPGSMFLSGGGRTLLGGAFLRWARNHPATVLSTYSVDGGGTLPSSAEWLLHATTGRLVVEPRSGGLQQITLETAFGPNGKALDAVSLQLQPGRGLIRPDAFPSRRGADRGDIDASRLLVITLVPESPELQAWATATFHADVVADPMEAMSHVQGGTRYGGVLLFAARGRIRDALNTCRALRPLTPAAIVFASDDAVRASDRIALLEAGADDCLSGGVDFRELGVRLRQSIASGARIIPSEDHRPAEGGPSLEGGVLDGAHFRSAAERRAAEQSHSVFCLLDLRAHGVSKERLLEVVSEEIRAEDGDLATGDGDRTLVLLQGARFSQAEPFLSRARSRLARDGEGASLTVETLCHPADATRIRNALGELRAASD